VRQLRTKVEPTGLPAHNLRIARPFLFGTRSFRWFNSECQCVPLWLEFSSPEADHSVRASLAPPARTKLEGLFVSQQDQGDMKVDACDAACSMDHRIFGPPKPIVAFLYNCIIEARSGCA
jgi:hypothetical protein